MGTRFHYERPDDVAKKSSPKQHGTLKSSETTPIQRYYYGQIGIPAVAAAASYQGDSKNPAYARLRSTLLVGSRNHDKPQRAGHPGHRYKRRLVSHGMELGATSVETLITGARSTRRSRRPADAYAYF